jgi:hypothetical protein
VHSPGPPAVSFDPYSRNDLCRHLHRVIRHCLMMAETLNELIPHRRSPEEYLQEYWITSYKNIQKISAKTYWKLQIILNMRLNINTRPQTLAKKNVKMGELYLSFNTGIRVSSSLHKTRQLHSEARWLGWLQQTFFYYLKPYSKQLCWVVMRRACLSIRSIL